MEEQPQFDLVTSLIGNGINEKDIEKLNGAGFYTVRSISNTSKRALCQINGISEKKAETIMEKAREHLPIGFQTAAQLLEQRANLICLSTGSSKLDSLLGGGIETGSLTEIYGEYRTGKTQLCHTLAVVAQLPLVQNGGEGKALYIDTEGTFRPERVRAAAKRFGINEDSAINNVAVGRAYSHEQLMVFLNQAKQLMSQTRFSLVVVDSVMAHLRSERAGRGELSERQIELNKLLSTLQTLADEFGVAVVYTNQVTASVDGGYGEQKKAIGGHVMSHRCTTRLMFKKGKGNARICRVVDSPILPEAETQFGIYTRGIDDVEEEE